MDVTVHIPTWIAWAAGIFGGVLLLALSALGLATVLALTRFSLWR